MKKILINLLFSIPLLTTFYLTDGSYIWKSPNDWSYWTYKQEYHAGQGIGHYNFDVQVPLGVKFWHEGTNWRIPFNQIVKITDE